MAEQLLPIHELKAMGFDIKSLVEGYPRGSFERSVHLNAARGVVNRLEWVIAQLEKHGEGQKVST